MNLPESWGPTPQLSERKKHFLEKGSEVFHKPNRKSKEETDEQSDLYEQIGRLKMELEWLKIFFEFKGFPLFSC